MKGLLSLLFSFTSIITMAQVHGFVKDKDDNSPLEYANVVLSALNDSNVIGYAVTDSTGYFSLNTTTSEGKVKISFLGYKTQEITVGSTDLGTILMAKDENMLGEVTVKAKRFVRSADGVTANVANTILSKMGNATDVLKHIPFVTIKNDEVSIMGNGTPVIYINNRKLVDFDELKQIQSSDIKKVKVITNPGAEYDATVNAVIRIYTSRPVGEGFGGSVDANIRLERRPTQYGGASFNYRKGGLDIFGTLRYGHTRLFYNQSDNTKYHNWETNESIKISGENESWSSSLGFNYQYKEKWSVGAEYKNHYVPSDCWKTADTSKVYMDGKLRNAFSSDDVRREPMNRHYVNGYFNYNFSEETFIQLNTDYTNYSKTNKQNYVAANKGINTKNETDNILYAGKLKFVTPIAGGRLNAGIEGSYTKNSNEYKVGKETTLENELSDSENAVKTNIVATFVEYEKSFGENWSIKAGGRFEHEGFEYVENENDRTSRNNNGFYPSASIAYKNDDISMSLAYRNTTKRPNYFALRSAVAINSPYDYEGGTPNLKNTNRNRITYSLGWNDLQLTVAYAYSTNSIIYVKEMYQNSDSITIFHTQNIDHNQYWYVTAVYSPTLFKIWNPSLTLDFTKQYLRYKGMDYNKPIVTFEMQNMVSLPHNLTLGADMNWNTSGNNAAEIHYAYSDFNFDAYCIKTLFNDRLTLKFSVENLFNTSRETWVMENDGIRLGKWTDQPRRTFTLSAKYIFNPAKKKYKGEAASSELNRF